MLESDPLLTPVRLRLQALRDEAVPPTPPTRRRSQPRRRRRQLQQAVGTALVSVGTRLQPTPVADVKPC